MKTLICALFASSLSFHAVATEQCEIRDNGMGSPPTGIESKSPPSGGVKNWSNQCGSNKYSKNTEECPQPKSFCISPVYSPGTTTIIGASDPIAATVDCQALGGGRLWCNTNPTSVDAAFTYHWSFIRNNQVVYSGYNHSSFDMYCSENTPFGVQVVVSDIFGQTETIYTSAMCLVGQEN